MFRVMDPEEGTGNGTESKSVPDVRYEFEIESKEQVANEQEFDPFAERNLEKPTT